LSQLLENEATESRWTLAKAGGGFTRECECRVQWTHSNPLTSLRWCFSEHIVSMTYCVTTGIGHWNSLARYPLFKVRRKLMSSTRLWRNINELRLIICQRCIVRISRAATNIFEALI
jgi:hypothetical protein